MLTRPLCLITLLVLASLTVRCVAADVAKESLAQVKQAIDDKTAVLVDVREKREWDAGHVEGALLMPLSELKEPSAAEKLVSKLPKGKVIYTHCAVGKRAVAAGGILEKYGYEVRCLKPGYQALIEAGFPKAMK